ncbi:UDP-N-acetylmuramoyl-L-alanyl-D-glutamate--2,6-diaminopimelate ligase [Desulfovibrio ferrophilus]|uniref:UDP-N-acetylmuramoyl-L-alanyl-D-glutamate--2,6-diaminopimelate ligase n=1 Tax=Desulfovibrio ferrophilus TaxID=241368 RepID=A0A2Z6AZ79_9BACT|nr:UDP-N-acetylmuramoyl-L-alanyl-D-glutamate--2,6-diaminopimelate ligase [Desulfovibrio ferrophilus]BBD08549.1 UDP-N-acetylmuramoyl-L-alanyl-D-glutamate--2,6-diaminopimelate ligase [Desulfovibrio ferrophilus]
MKSEYTWDELLAKVADGLMVRSDSRAVQPGEVFVAIPGASTDATAYVPDAVARGAAYVVARSGQHMPAGTKAKLIVHENPRRALGELAAAYFKTREKGLTVVGITGTNGKTTISYMLEHLLAHAGHKVGVIGTVSYRWPGFTLEAPLTTPDCWQLHELVSNMAGSGVDTVVMEVSSHALDQDRIWGLDYDVAVLTNITQDHLDYHGNMDSYFRAKAKLFEEISKPGKVAILNADDSYGRILLQRYNPAIGYGLRYPNVGEGKGLSGEIRSMNSNGLVLKMKFGDDSWELSSPLIGRHNASNLLAVQGVGLALGLKPKKLKALEKFMGVPGRLERIENNRGLNIFVDYAHTPDALDNVLSGVRELDFKRLLCVFGCGGNRDKAKRPLMAEAVCRHSDVAVLTSDNPRHEVPLEIMNDVRPGLGGCAEVIEDPDRRQAIAKAIAEMGPRDVLIVAGKGHETYQDIGGERFPFNDAEVIRELAC